MLSVVASPAIRYHLIELSHALLDEEAHQPLVLARHPLTESPARHGERLIDEILSH